MSSSTSTLYGFNFHRERC